MRRGDGVTRFFRVRKIGSHSRLDVRKRNLLLACSGHGGRRQVFSNQILPLRGGAHCSGGLIKTDFHTRCVKQRLCHHGFTRVFVVFHPWLAKDSGYRSRNCRVGSSYLVLAGSSYTQASSITWPQLHWMRMLAMRSPSRCTDRRGSQFFLALCVLFSAAAKATCPKV